MDIRMDSIELTSQFINNGGINMVETIEQNDMVTEKDYQQINFIINCCHRYHDNIDPVYYDSDEQ